MLGAAVQQEEIRPVERGQRSIDNVVDSGAFPPDIKCFEDLRPYVLKCFEALTDKNNYERKGDYLHSKTEEIITKTLAGMGFCAANAKLFSPKFDWIMKENNILKCYFFREIPSKQHAVIFPVINICDALIIEYGYKKSAEDDSWIIYEPSFQKADAQDLTNKFMDYVYSKSSYLRMIKEIK